MTLRVIAMQSSIEIYNCCAIKEFAQINNGKSLGTGQTISTFKKTPIEGKFNNI